MILFLHLADWCQSLLYSSHFCRLILCTSLLGQVCAAFFTICHERRKNCLCEKFTFNRQYSGHLMVYYLRKVNLVWFFFFSVISWWPLRIMWVIHNLDQYPLRSSSLGSCECKRNCSVGEIRCMCSGLWAICIHGWRGSRRQYWYLPLSIRCHVEAVVKNDFIPSQIFWNVLCNARQQHPFCRRIYRKLSTTFKKQWNKKEAIPAISLIVEIFFNILFCLLPKNDTVALLHFHFMD